MVTLGDTLAVIGILFGISLSSWAVLMAYLALFPRRSYLAAERIEAHPWRAAILGGVLWLSLTPIALGLTGSFIPLIKVAGLALLMVLIALTSVGASGLSHLMSRRLRSGDPDMTEYGAHSRASLMLVSAPLLPLVGWFAIIPAMLFVGLGAGLGAIFARSAEPSTPSFGFGK